MENNDNPIWRFFASVRLALFILLILATTSVIGTLIPQGKPPEFYIEAFGPKIAHFFQILDVPQMYGSLWFICLLLLFCNNLIVCTIDRLPGVWRMVVLNNLGTPLERLGKMPHRQVFMAVGDAASLGEAVGDLLVGNGWKAQAENKPDGLLLFSQKTPWSRLGVYVVHLSILLIFSGALIGSLMGYKAFVMIPEGAATATAYQFGTEKPIPLGFSVRCDEFTVSYYDDGHTPKEYRSVLTVTDPTSGKTITRPIVVNDPLSYKGITFYQSSYEPRQEFKINITTKADNKQQEFRTPFGQKTSWPGTEIEFGVINRQIRSSLGDVGKIKLWFFDGQGEPSIFWLENKDSKTITRPSGTYEIQISQLFATGLEVAKDPGVWTVYAGCTLMLVGLYVAFFLSHRRIWVYISLGKNEQQSRILLCGASSKNRVAFEKEFAGLTGAFAENPTFTLVKEEQA